MLARHCFSQINSLASPQNLARTILFRLNLHRVIQVSHFNQLYSLLSQIPLVKLDKMSGVAAEDKMVAFRDASKAPLRKLSVDLISTYKHINEVGIVVFLPFVWTC